MSHTIWGSFDGANVNYIRPYIEVSWTQNQAQNTSTVTATLYFHRYTNNYWTYNELTNSNGHSCTFSVGGNSLTQIRPFNLQKSPPPNGVAIWSRTRTIQHNTDGTATVNISASGSTNVNPDTYAFGESVTLPTIPRQSTISSVSMANQLRPSVSNTLSISISRKHSSYTHRFQIMDGSTELFYTTGQVPTSLTITGTDINKLIDRMPTETSRQFTFRVTTVSGGTVIGRTTKNFTVTLNDDYTSPEITSTGIIIDGDGYDNQIGKFVRTVSRLRAQISTSVFGRGASLRSMSVDIDGTPISGRMIGDTFYRAESNVLNESGTFPVNFTVTNSRGQSTTETRDMTVWVYNPPAIQEFSGYRSDTNQTNVLITRKYSRSWLGGDNVPTARIEKRLSTATTWTSVNDSGDLDLSTTSTNNQAARSYVFRTVIEDKFGRTATAEFSVGTARVLMEKFKDEGVSFGKRFETGRGTLQVMGDIRHVDDEFNVESNITKPEFVPITLQNGWEAQITSTYGLPGIYKSGGIVYFTGNISHPGNPLYQGTIFTVPEGYRPIDNKYVPIITSAPDTPIRVYVLRTGQVRLETRVSGNVSFCTLFMISYPVGR